MYRLTPRSINRPCFLIDHELTDQENFVLMNLIGSVAEMSRGILPIKRRITYYITSIKKKMLFPCKVFKIVRTILLISK